MQLGKNSKGFWIAFGGVDVPQCSCLVWWHQWSLDAHIHPSSHGFRFESDSANFQLILSPPLSPLPPPAPPRPGSWPHLQGGWGGAALPSSGQPPRRATPLWAPQPVAVGLDKAGSRRLTSPPAGRSDPCCISSPSPPPLPLLLLLLLLLLQYFISKDPETPVGSMARRMAPGAAPTRICSSWMLRISFP